MGDAIQILGQRKEQGFVQSVLIPNRCHTIEKYGCGVSDCYKKWLEKDVYIAVGTTSSITFVPDTRIIPTYWFHFISKKTNLRLCGSTCRILIYVIPINISGDDIAISLWKECTNIPSKFDRTSLENAPALVVVTISSVKISTYVGSLRLGTGNVSHLYINPPIPETTILIDIYGTFLDSPVNFEPPTLLSDVLEKTHSDLSDKSFTAELSTSEYISDCWYQVQCPNCKIATFKQGKNWFCPSDAILTSPSTTFKLSAIITDESQSMIVVLSDNATQDLFGTTSDKLISDDDINHRKQLPPIAALQGIPKKMKLHMTNTSTDNNIRFIITNIDKPPLKKKYPYRHHHHNIQHLQNTVKRDIADLLEAAQSKLDESFSLDDKWAV
ncbi:unnamed protein product [Lactuca virosa]|uniref:Replication factor A C-terminal domain-containing protein n=1 Tax=Lactuca virosa TaxID=75947 RepID=A0AAU9M955_9ASTR|nr:unnamed protein product [Lactuca virosa]